MERANLPIACTLTADQLRERRDGLLRRVGSAVQETIEREGGHAFRFPPELFEELAGFVAMERRCCGFLRLTPTAEPGNGPVWLEPAGPPGAKAFLASFWS